MVICYSRGRRATSDLLLVVVNLDPHHRQSSWLALDLPALGMDDGTTFQVHDLLSDARYLCSGPRVFVDLDPHAIPAHIFRVRRHVRSEKAFEYYQ